MPDVLKKFGKYFLLDLVAQGGMAEIYRARASTPDGGARLVAIKRVLASFSQNPEFVSMFKSEIKTTSGFTHQNIVQIYDFGEYNQQIYLAMELVDGKNLRQVMSRAAEQKRPIPIEVCVYLMEQSAAALSYAHTYKDKITGKSLNIIHRDISPQNILVSFEGSVKVIDFGIAKAVTNSESTRAGIIKGKPSYLSPEQIVGDELDGRSDIFALGIVFWEILTGRKLFSAENDLAVIKMIENCSAYVVPPSRYNPNITEELDAIVLKCLHRDRESRYPHAEELRRVLHRFLYQFFSEYNPSDLSYYVRDIFKKEIVDDRQKLQKLNDKAEQLLSSIESENTKNSGIFQTEQTATVPMKGNTSTQMPTVGPNKKIKIIEVDSNEKEKKPTKVGFDTDHANKVIPTKTVGPYQSEPHGTKTVMPANQSKIEYATSTYSKEFDSKKSIPVRKKSSNFGSVFAVASVILLAILGYYYFSSSNHDENSNTRNVASTSSIVIQGNVSQATVVVNDSIVSKSLPYQISNVPSGKLQKITVYSNGFESQSQEIALNNGEKRVLNFDLKPETVNNSSSQQLTLRLRILPQRVGLNTKVEIDGKSIDSLTTLAVVQVNKPFEIYVERDHFKPYKKMITITAEQAGSSKEWVQTVELSEARFGYLSIKTTPSSEALIDIDGQQQKVMTPFVHKKLPVGKYKVRLFNPVLDMEKNIEVLVNEELDTRIEERLSPSGRIRTPSSSH